MHQLDAGNTRIVRGQIPAVCGQSVTGNSAPQSVNTGGTSVRILIALPVENSESFFQTETHWLGYTVSQGGYDRQLRLMRLPSEWYRRPRT